MGNIILVESLIRSTYRFLRKENKLQEIERTFLGFIKNVIKSRNKSEERSCFVKLKSSLMDITGSSEARISSFDLMAWVESKIMNLPFEDVVKNNFSKKRQKAA